MPAPGRSLLFLLLSSTLPVAAQSYTTPAGERPVARHSGSSILPGGRIVAPFGEESPTGAGAFGLAVSPSGKTVVTANLGPARPSLTILERSRDNRWETRQVVTRSPDALEQYDATDWHGVSLGVALSGDHSIYVSEGNSGRIALFDSTDQRRRVFDLNQGGFHDSFTGDLALDPERSILYAADQANFRVAVLDLRSRQILTSVPVGRLPFAMALSPDRTRLYVTNLGMFHYRALPGADASRPRETGLEFPAFGFPSADALAGIARSTAGRLVAVPGLGDPNAPESNSLCVLNVATPQSAKVEGFIRTGLPSGGDIIGGSGPAGVAATADRIFVANSNQDSVTVIDAHTNRAVAEIPLHIPGIETLRGLLPIGLAFAPASGNLLVAEAGINAVGVVDPRQGKVLGHIPVAWFPSRVAVVGDSVFVANARGHGVGPNAPGAISSAGGLLPSQLYQGTISLFHLPSAEDLAKSTALVMELNGFHPRRAATQATRYPAAIRHVVLIVKEARGYDELLGDIVRAANGPVMGSPALAHLGSLGFVDGKHQRLSLKQVNVTPNHHALAQQWAFSDNYYADSEGSAEGRHWLVGAYPNAWTESSLLEAYGSQKEFRLGSAPGRLSFPGDPASLPPEDLTAAGTLWDHLARHAVSFLHFGDALTPANGRLLTNLPVPEPLYRNTVRRYPRADTAISDQSRAAAFIREIDERYVRAGADLPRFLWIHLPNDAGAPARPGDGYPYDESFVADNDYALGRIVEYLSGTKWWKQMAIFVTEADAGNGIDHIDAHRTLLLCASPWAKRNYVSHRNTGHPGLLKTIFGLLRLPALNLFDAAAADLGDCFAAAPDYTPFRAVDVDHRIFDPAAEAVRRRMVQ